MPPGRPTKFDQVDKEQMSKLYLAGWTDKQVADFFKITYKTIDNWKKKYPNFFTSLKDWKTIADHKVEKSLYERACGYQHKAIKIFHYMGRSFEHEYIEHYPPDTTACIFFFFIRKHAEWKERHEFDFEFSPETFEKIADAISRADTNTDSLLQGRTQICN